MNVEIEAEAALFPEKEYISGIFVAVLFLPLLASIHVPSTPYLNSINFLSSLVFMFLPLITCNLVSSSTHLYSVPSSYHLCSFYFLSLSVSLPVPYFPHPNSCSFIFSFVPCFFLTLPIFQFLPLLISFPVHSSSYRFSCSFLFASVLLFFLSSPLLPSFPHLNFSSFISFLHPVPSFPPLYSCSSLSSSAGIPSRGWSIPSKGRTPCRPWSLTTARIGRKLWLLTHLPFTCKNRDFTELGIC